MIDVSGIEFAYPHGEFQLRIDKLTVAEGVQAAVIGPSGSGKTTLLNLVAGIHTPRCGSIAVGHQAVNHLADAARRNFRIAHIGLVFQEFELIEYLTVLDNILLPFRINRTLRRTSETLDRARALANRLQVGDKLNRYPPRLSQGERQRVAICRALITGAKTVLADEPTGNLDPVNKNRVMDLLLDYAQENAVTLLAVTHDHSLLDRFQRVIDFEDFLVWRTSSDRRRFPAERRRDA